MAVKMYSMEDVQNLLKEGIAGDAKKMQEAETILHGMLSQHPDNWAAVFFMGNIFLHRNLNGVAINLLERAAELEPRCPETWNNLGTAYRKENLNTQAERCLKKALELKPNDPDVYNNLGTLHINEGEPEKAIEYLDKGVELAPTHNQCHWNRGLARLELGDWDGGFEDYAYGLASNDRLVKSYRWLEVPENDGSEPPPNATPKEAVWWDGEAHPEEVIVVYGEQGIGDEIMFASMLPDFRDRFQGRVIIDCHPRLESLFRASFPWATVYPTRKVIDRPMGWEEAERPAFKVAIGNLGKWFRKKEEDFPKTPYIIPDPAKVEEYKEWITRTGPGPYVGVGWVGGHKKTRKDIRSIKLDELTPVLKLAGTVFSIQYSEHGEEDPPGYLERTGIKIWHFPEVFQAGKWERYFLNQTNPESGEKTVIAMAQRKDDIKVLQAQFGGEIEHVPGAAYDYGEAAAFMMALSQLGGKIVSVNASQVHLCGAMGISLYTLTPHKAAWRYNLKREDMVWYGSIRQFRQTPIGGWTDALKKLEQQIIFDFQLQGSL